MRVPCLSLPERGLWEAGSAGGFLLPPGFGRLLPSEGTGRRKPRGGGGGQGGTYVRKRQDFLRVPGPSLAPGPLNPALGLSPY